MQCGSCASANAANAIRCGRCGAPLAPAKASAKALGDRPLLADAGLLLAYLALSSWLGLTGRFLFLADPAEALRFVVAIWRASLFADLVFTAGTLATGAGAYLLARRGWVTAALLAGLVGTWATYALSWALVVASDADFDVPDADLIVFVAVFGSIGLLFASLAPALLGARDRAAALEAASGSLKA